MKKQLLFTTLLTSLSYASTFTLTNNQSGSVYQCSPGGGSSGGDPQCVGKIQQFCDANTSHGDDDCFHDAVNACSNGANAECVPDVFKNCDDNTSLSDDECFDQSLQACNGSKDSIKFLMQAAQKKALMDALKISK